MKYTKTSNNDFKALSNPDVMMSLLDTPKHNVLHSLRKFILLPTVLLVAVLTRVQILSHNWYRKWLLTRANCKQIIIYLCKIYRQEKNEGNFFVSYLFFHIIFGSISQHNNSKPTVVTKTIIRNIVTCCCKECCFNNT